MRRLRCSVIFWATVLSLALPGCASRPDAPTTALLPIVAPCTPEGFPQPPASYADDDLPKGAARIVDRYRLGASANAARKARLAIVEPVIAACRAHTTGDPAS